MDTLYPRCAGIDVHKNNVVVCVRCADRPGKVFEEIRTFSTMTADLLALADWLTGHGVTHVAMESTGVYWKPVFNILEGGVCVILVNAEHIKKVPGRKTDVKDCQWIAQLLQHGLLHASFVPPQPIRELRDLTRQRTQLIQERSAAVNRIQKVLEDANIKLAGVATDVLGVSGRDMLEALIAGETDPAKLADLAQASAREDPGAAVGVAGTRDGPPPLPAADAPGPRHAPGGVDRPAGRPHRGGPRPFCGGGRAVADHPGRQPAGGGDGDGGDRREDGAIPHADHLASWAGMCSGNNESAGKRRSGRTTKGNRWLKRILVQAAWAASHTKGTYLAAQYRRLAKRRGCKRALVAVGHTLLVIIYHVLKRGTTYAELGADFLDRLEPERLTRQLVKRLEALGHKVTLEPEHAA